MIDLPEMYPFYPPNIHFITPIYHPNIDTAGRICLDYLKMPPQGSWNPTITLGALLMTIKQLLAEPNPDDPLMPEIATEYKFNQELFCFKAKEHLKKFNQKIYDIYFHQFFFVTFFIFLKFFMIFFKVLRS